MPDISKWNIHGTEYNVADSTARADITGLQSAVQGKISAPASPTTGQFLSWNGSAWVAASLPLYNGGVS